MNICFVRHSIRNRGSDRSSLGYAEFLISKGHQVTYYTNEISTSFRYDPRIQIKRIPWAWPVGTILFTVFKAFEEDVVLVDLVVMAAFAHVRNAAKVIYLARDYDESYYRSLMLKALTRVFYHWAIGVCKVPVIACSATLAQKLKKFCPAPMITVNNGDDMSFFAKNAFTGLVSRGEALKDSVVIVLFVRFDHRKGLDIALKALDALQKTPAVKPWVVWMVGDPMKGEPGFPSKHFGFLERGALRDLLVEADIFLMASRSEGLSPLLLQALGCKCALVATTAANIVTHDENGLLSMVDDWEGLAEHLKILINDPIRLKQLKDQGRKLAEQYGWQASCAAFLKAIEELSVPGER
ncbi:MAG: glycosyltransferase family 4 protein [Candidatus Omnitrophica bacterium]|nr:glycosyltransferase family 4 protein [Candidatus Omnitrophota bacterium]